jgi:hypothetical protein
MSQRDTFLSVLAAALTVVLWRRRWAIDAGPGEYVRATVDGVEIRPFEVLRRLKTAQLSTAVWQETCRQSGIADIDLAEAGDPAGLEMDPA